ncbi:MAG TPA: circadian clock protein KaiC [Chthoniobacterales bacterium]|nr:circadian clock protein KaiC [Chthoniobacterales bacterium]
MKKPKSKPTRKTLSKSPTGIRGLDEITGGGLPTGRPTLICGGAGCGKTLLSMEFLVRGATAHDEPGVFVAFEETGEELTQNVASLGFDLKDLVARKKLLLDYIFVDRAEFQETGEYDLEGLFIRLGYAIDSIKAKRVVLDTIEVLFGALPNQSIVRAELRRLFRWLKEKGVTVIMTGERGDGTLTRFGLEEYVSDCVISLDHRVVDQVTTRRIRVVKYRGTTHGTNEYPFLIEKEGISIWPITSVQMEHSASVERIPTGIERLDTMLGGKGFYRGSSILLSGTAGTGKTGVSATFADATCRRGERCLYISFEESSSQIIRNTGTIGLNLQQWINNGRLEIQTVRPFYHGLEMHLARTIKAVSEFEPHLVIIDPISGLDTTGTTLEIKAALMRLLDFLKIKGITVMLTDLTLGAGVAVDGADATIPSLVDTWLMVRDIETDGERNRGLHVLKSRGMGHSNQVREFIVTSSGIQLTDVYIGPSGMLTGSARVQQEGRERAERVTMDEEAERQQLALECKRAALEAQIAALRAEFSGEEAIITRTVRKDKQRGAVLALDEAAMGRSRKGDVIKSNGSRRRNEMGMQA